MRFYLISYRMNEQPKKKEVKPTTVVEAATVRQVLTLVGQGYSYRRIEKETGIKQGRVFKIVNGLYRLKESSRCSVCGGKLTEKMEVCRKCRLEIKYGIKEEEEPENDEEFFIKLELRPKEYERYLVVRQRKLEEIERRIKQEQEEKRRRRRFEYD